LKRNPAPKAAPAPKKVVEEKVESAASTKQVSNNYIQKLKKNFEEYEKKVVATKAKIQELEQDFSKPEISSDAKKVEELTRFYEAEKKALVHLEKEMEAILEELIELEA